MYHIHTTRAIVLTAFGVGEGNKFFTLFTEEFGVIRAKAQNIRSSTSKLRFALQEYSFVNVSLVRGKDIWRITNAEPLYNLYFELREKNDVFMVCARMLSLVRRLVPEEGKEEKIFNDFFSLCAYAREESCSLSEIRIAEWLFIVRMLFVLGYVKGTDIGGICADEISWNKTYLDSVAFHKNSALFAINNALSMSQL